MVPFLQTALEYVDIDTRVLQAALLVAAAGIAGRFLPDGNTLLLTAGFLGGALNAPRTDEWEFATEFAALPGFLGAVAILTVMALGIPLGYYSFPIAVPASEQAFRITGPLLELHILVPLYAVEGVAAFTLLKRLPRVGVTEST